MTDDAPTTPLCRCGHDGVYHRTSAGPSDCRGCVNCPTVDAQKCHRYTKCTCEGWEPNP